MESRTINDLPNECLQKIFQNLTVQDKLNVEKVCQRWQYTGLQSWQGVKKLFITNLPENSKRLQFADKDAMFVDTDNDLLWEIFKRCGRYLLSIDSIIRAYSHETKLVLFISAYCKKIEEMNLSNYQLNLQAFAQMTNVCENLTKILFNVQNDRMSRDYVIKLLMRARKLQYFWAQNVEINLNFFPANIIRELRLDVCPIIYIQTVDNFPNLHTLILRSCYSITNSILQGMFTNMINLRVLKLSNLTLDKNDITPIGMLQIARLRHLEQLDVKGNRTFTNDVLEVITLNCPKLMYLNISYTSVTDAGIFELAKLEKFRVLVVKGRRVSGSTFISLKSLQLLKCLRCPNLDELYLKLIMEVNHQLQQIICIDCSSVTENVIQYAAEANELPNNRPTPVKVHYENNLAIHKIYRIEKNFERIKEHQDTAIALHNFNDLDWHDEKCFKNIDWHDEITYSQHDTTDPEIFLPVLPRPDPEPEGPEVPEEEAREEEEILEEEEVPEELENSFIIDCDDVIEKKRSPISLSCAAFLIITFILTHFSVLMYVIHFYLSLDLDS